MLMPRVSEVLGAAYLSRDPVMMEEVRSGIDLHLANQQLLKLPQKVHAKRFLFRLIYGGSGYSYANDPDFMGINDSPKYWDELIDEQYRKYRGLKQWHDTLVTSVMSYGFIEVPTGRRFTFLPEMKRGVLTWPRTLILNYPVQGFSADLMVLARVLLWKKLESIRSSLLWICTVHDSIVFDCPPEHMDILVLRIKETWAELPQFFERCFGVEFDLPCRVEVMVGENWKDMRVV